ncbi:hypothetical protein V8B97DRAFT_1917216 [Scleroderma yunnanense]
MDVAEAHNGHINQSNITDDLNSAANEDIQMEEVNDPGAYIIPFSVDDSISDNYRAWAVNDSRRNRPWYKEFVEANTRYEEWLFKKRKPGEYRIPFGEHEGQRLDGVPDRLRDWAINPANTSNGWYPIFVKENERYEEYLAMTRPPGMFPFPWGKPYVCKYEKLQDASRRYLDEVYSNRSLGSEIIWFGKRYRGYGLCEVYKRPGFIRFCLDPGKQDCRYYWRLKDLIDRYEAHLEKARARQKPRVQRRRPVVLNPCGELLGTWNDDQGSAGGSDDEYQKDDFVVSDEDIESEGETESDEGSDYETTDFIEDGDDMVSGVNTMSQESARDDMPLDKLERSLKKDKNKNRQEADSDESPSPSPRLTRLRKKSSHAL